MDFQAFVDNIDVMTCVISVEMKEDGNYGDIRIVTGNKAYIDSIETPWEGPALQVSKFIPNSLYQTYFPKDLNFETVCYTAAVLKRPVHTYVHPERYDFWFNLFMLPLINEGNMYYCTYTQQVTREADSEQMADVLSAGRAKKVLNTCIKLHGAMDFAETMEAVLKDISSICLTESCSLILVNQKERTCKILAQDKRRETLADDPGFYEIVESWPKTLDGTNCLLIKNDVEMNYIKEKNPNWYTSLEKYNVKSIVLFPLKGPEGLIGYIWATNFNTEDAENIKETLELTTYFLASAVSNHILMNRLRVMGSVDILTGVLNRNEMNNRIDRLNNGEDHMRNVGVVFADLNGLKRVNDKEGHFSGDEVLKDAAKALQNVFKGVDIFRAGGDEFMFLVPDANEDDLKKKVDIIRGHEFGYKDVGFAVGTCFIEDSKDILNALHVADELMYKDKDEFYKKHPRLKR
ncbi:MAG: GGDEF domain-containing protein [Clostridiales bacterium]|nr:GGDEF domain-containing protein [Clostridiales bacterium]